MSKVFFEASYITNPQDFTGQSKKIVLGYSETYNGALNFFHAFLMKGKNFQERNMIVQFFEVKELVFDTLDYWNEIKKIFPNDEMFSIHGV